MPLLFADHFLVGALLTLLLPTLLLSAVAAWYFFEFKRVPRDIPPSATAVPPTEVVAAAEQAKGSRGAADS